MWEFLPWEALLYLLPKPLRAGCLWLMALLLFILMLAVLASR